VDGPRQMMRIAYDIDIGARRYIDSDIMKAQRVSMPERVQLPISASAMIGDVFLDIFHHSDKILIRKVAKIC
jgi:hypothetical protein